MSTLKSAIAADSPPRLADGIVDCEFHATVESLEQLLPYLDETWQHRLTTSEFSLPPASPHPGVDIEAHRLTAQTDPAGCAAALEPGLEAAILVPSQAMTTAGWLSQEMAAAFVSAINDYLIEEWLPADQRFRLAIAVSPHDPALAAAEIRRLGSQSRVVAVCMPLVAIAMGNRHYHPIYAACQELGLPVMVHPSGAEGSVVGPAALGGVGPRTPEETHTLLPQVAMANLASAVFDGLFEEFPKLTVVFAGFGFSWAPPALWRADAEWRGLRVEVPWLKRSPSEYVGEHVRIVVDAASELVPESAWSVAGMLPEGVLVYGSDRPYQSIPVAERLAAAPDDLRPHLAGLNARESFPL